MKNSFIYSMAATFITAALAMGSLTSCSKEELATVKQNTTPAKVYTVSIPASMGEEDNMRGVEFGGDGSTITSKFKTGDKVYVYNETQGAFACESDGTPIVLRLTAGDISNEGKNCTLSGNLTFFKADGMGPEKPHFVAVNPGENDTYSFFYNMSYVDACYSYYNCYNYFGQDGSATEASSHDFAKKTGVTMTATGNTMEPSATVSFESLQSMFRQRLSFTQGPSGEGSTSPSIKKLTVSTKNGTLASQYLPLSSKYYLSEMEINNPQITANGDIFCLWHLTMEQDT